MSLMGGMYWGRGWYSTAWDVGVFGEVAGLVYQSHLLKKSRGNGKAAFQHRNAEGEVARV